MTTVEMLLEMIEMQKALDKSIYEGNNVEYNQEKCYLALFDELGELNHELKKAWCWWKKTQKEVDRTRVLEELVDVTHFLLSIYYHKVDSITKYKFRHYISAMNVSEFKSYSLVELYTTIIDDRRILSGLEMLIALTEKLGFTIEDVYKGYIEKNKENFNRLARGY